MKRALIAIVTAALPMLVFAAPAAAQPRRPGPPGGPEAAFQIRLGMFMPSADSDLWDVNEQLFTLDSSDFDDFVFGLSYVRSYGNQVEIAANVDFYNEVVLSQERDFVDDYDSPILHDTELSLVPLTADVRFIPGGRYRIRPGGRYILKPVFYIGAGAGLNFWEYEEVGDFVGLDDLGYFVFPDRLIDDGVAFEVHALAGVEIPLGRSSNLLFETRYSVSEDDLGGPFDELGVSELDLGGSSIYGGLSFRF